MHQGAPRGDGHHRGTVGGPTYAGLVTGLEGVISIAAGSFHSCALVRGGAMECWGHNALGELGNGSTTISLVPVMVTP